MYDEDLYLDNQDDSQDFDEETLDDQEDGDQDPDNHQEDTEPKKNKGGNLHAALQEERRLRQQYEQELRRHQALLQSIGQGQHQQQRQQVDPAVAQRHREQLQEMMLERPDEFLSSFGQSIRSQVLNEIRTQNAPLLVTQAERIIQRNPQHRSLYETPEVRDVVDAFIANEVQTGGITNHQDLAEVIPRVMDSLTKIIGATGGKAGGNGDPAKARLSTTVGKGASGGNRRSMDQIWAEKEQLAKSNPKAYTEWSRSEKGKKFLNAYLFGR